MINDWKLTEGEVFIFLLIVTLISYLFAFISTNTTIKIIALLVGISISLYETIEFLERGHK